MALAYETLAGDIDHLIADDHAVVERQFQHLEAGRGNRKVLVEQISFELSLHAFGEEVVLYPLWDDHGMQAEKKDATSEHQKMKEFLVTLAKHEPSDLEFETALSELIRAVRHHVTDEEQQELPRFRGKVGAAKMAELGKEFLAAKRKAPPAPHPHAPTGGIAQKIGMIVKPIDMAKAEASGVGDDLATDATGTLPPQAQAILDALSSLHALPYEILEPDQARKQPDRRRP